MLYSELYSKLILLTKRNDITSVEIADCIGVKHGAMFARAKRNSKMNDNEIDKIEKYYKVNLNSIITIDNSLEAQEDKTINKKLSGFGLRLNEVQKATNLSDRDFAKLLGLFADELSDLKSLEKEPNVKILNIIKKNFKISIDWLLYGE